MKRTVPAEREALPSLSSLLSGAHVCVPTWFVPHTITHTLPTNPSSSVTRACGTRHAVPLTVMRCGEPHAA